MKMKDKFGMRMLAISCAIAIVASSMAVYSHIAADAENGIGEGKGIIALMPPPFIGTVGAAETVAGAAFPADDAGIAAYEQLKSGIKLEDVKPAFASIFMENPDFIIGTVAVGWMTEDEYPYVYVASDGWVVSYYPRDQEASHITPFGYSWSTTNLNEVMRKVYGKIGAVFNPDKLGYYDFRNPDATGMIVAKEASPNIDFRSSRFYVTIPDSFTVYEVSWAYCAPRTENYAKLDGRKFVEGYAGELDKKRYGSFDSADFEKGVEHELEVYTYLAETYLGLVIIYNF
jgi:hypothetical protein